MIEIARHIEILLIDNDCVIVPGLGGFMAHPVTAHYNTEEQLFLPPCRVLGFNPQLCMNDSLLAGSYVEAYDLSYPEALRRIESEVSELRQHLENEGSYLLNNVGLLSYNEEGHLEFEPVEMGILTPSLYGLSPFAMDALEVKEKQGVGTLSFSNTQAEDTETRTSSSYDNVEDADGSTEEEQEGALVIKMSWVRNAIAIAAAVIAYFIMSPTISSDYQQKGVTMSAVVAPQGKPAPPKAIETTQSTTAETNEANEVTEATETSKTTETTEAAETTEKTETPEVVEPTKTSYYCIVLASQVSQRNADIFVEQLHRNGFTDAKVIEHHNIRRVIYGSYNTMKEAADELRTNRKSHFFEEAWVYNVK